MAGNLLFNTILELVIEVVVIIKAHIFRHTKNVTDKIDNFR